MSTIEHECLASISEAMVVWLRKNLWRKAVPDETWNRVQRAFVYLVYGGQDYGFSRF